MNPGDIMERTIPHHRSLSQPGLTAYGLLSATIKGVYVRLKVQAGSPSFREESATPRNDKPATDGHLAVEGERRTLRRSR